VSIEKKVSELMKIAWKENKAAIAAMAAMATTKEVTLTKQRKPRHQQQQWQCQEELAISGNSVNGGEGKDRSNIREGQWRWWRQQ
jgi:hypothetical protein